MADAILTVERLKELLDYDPETGTFTRRISVSQNTKAGDVAGSINGEGYAQISIDYRRYKMHRLAWLFMTGTHPVQEVDHINGNRADNRWSNLREVTREQNLQNQRKAESDSSTGFLGVKPCPGRPGFFLAQINFEHKRKHLGTFRSAEDAHQAYLTAKRELHSSCSI
jgi:hypothetical protein